MQHSITLKVIPSEAVNESVLRQYAANSLGKTPNDITGFYIMKRSIDARGKQVWINLILKVFIQEPFFKRTVQTIGFKNIKGAAHKAIVIGAGPAGLFAALKL